MHVPVGKRQNWEMGQSAGCGSAAGPSSHDWGTGDGASVGGSVGIFVCCAVVIDTSSSSSSSSDRVAALDGTVAKENGRILFMVFSLRLCRLVPCLEVACIVSQI